MQRIIPNLWYKGVAEEAVNFYLSIFPDSKIIKTYYYPMEGLLDFQKPFAGKILTIEFQIFGQKYIAINAGNEFSFNEAVSLAVICDNQEEIDFYWNKLTENGGQESVCGWCKDKFGLSWQIVPSGIDDLVSSSEKFAKMLTMKKIIVSELN